MDPKQRVAMSSFISLHLRHEPEKLGLVLEPGGWVTVADILAGCARRGKPLARAELDEIVRTDGKQRFSFDESGERIRANQGHSTSVDLQLEPAHPPAVLFHGTASRNVDSIRRHGLRKMARHHVHLSFDIAAARTVGGRHGKPVVFEVDAAGMKHRGYSFYRSVNGVWLTDEVPPEFLRLLEAA
jgi:putative RNA 2'-phosphotransferase